MSDPILLRTGKFALTVLSSTAIGTSFKSKYNINCESTEVSYISLPSSFSLNGLSAASWVGKVCLIYDNSSSNSTYAVVGDVTKSYTSIGTVSIKAATNLEYSCNLTHDFSIYVFSDNPPNWNSKDLDSQIQTYGIVLGGLSETVYADNAAGIHLSGESSVKYQDFDPYLITLDRNVGNINYSKVKSKGVIGAIVEAGYLYDMFHVEQSEYRNPNIKKQIEALDSAELPFGLWTITRARSVAEAKKELKELAPLIRTYPPKLGVWLKFNLTKNITINDNIINTYYEEFVNLGLMDQIGLYTSRSDLKQITWKNHQQWYLWLIDHVNSFVDIDQLLTPQFFKLD